MEAPQNWSAQAILLRDPTSETAKAIAPQNQAEVKSLIELTALGDACFNSLGLTSLIVISQSLDVVFWTLPKDNSN